jgi:hypothetical protein
LEFSANPFAVLVMAHLKMYNRGLTREGIIRLFQLIDRMMTLPNPLQERLEQKLQQFEEERTMPLLSNMELRGLEKGKEIGEEIGKGIGAQEKAQSAVRTVLQARFGSAPEIEALTQITNLRQLDDLLRLAATVENLEAFETALTALI